MVSSWRSSRLALVLFCLILLVQVSIPASRLNQHDLAPRFGWQMFSVRVVAPTIEVTNDDGSTRTIELEDKMARVRADIDIARHMPAHLCATIDNAVTLAIDGVEIKC